MWKIRLFRCTSQPTRNGYPKPYVKPDSRKGEKSITNQRRLAKTYYLTAGYKPYEKGKKQARQPKKPPEEAAVFGNLLCLISLESSDIDFTAPQKEEINTIKERRKKENAITSPLRPPPLLPIGSSLIPSPPPWRR